MLREEKRRGTQFGVEADRLTSLGKLVPDEVICGVVRSWLSAHDGSFVFDGFPRSLGQAKALEEMLRERATPLEVALSLEVDHATISRRVQSRLVCQACRTNVSIGLHVGGTESACPKCGGVLVRRSDDNPETLASRMKEYEEKSFSLIAHYCEHGLLRSIDATTAPEMVFARITSILEGE